MLLGERKAYEGNGGNGGYCSKDHSVCVYTEGKDDAQSQLCYEGLYAGLDQNLPAPHLVHKKHANEGPKHLYRF